MDRTPFKFSPYIKIKWLRIGRSLETSRPQEVLLRTQNGRFVLTNKCVLQVVSLLTQQSHMRYDVSAVKWFMNSIEVTWRPDSGVVTVHVGTEAKPGFVHSFHAIFVVCAFSVVSCFSVLALLLFSMDVFLSNIIIARMSWGLSPAYFFVF